MKGTLVRGAALGLVSVGIERAVGFGVLLAAARLLAPAEFGAYTFLLAGIAPLQVMADQGLEVVTVATMARLPHRQAKLLAALLVARVTLWGCLALPLAATLLGGTGGGALRPAAIVASGLVLFGPSMPYRSLARARGEMDRMLAISASDAVVSASLMLVVLLAGGGVLGLLGARVGASALVTAGAGWLAPVKPSLGTRDGIGGAGRLAREAWPLAANALLLSLVVRAGHLVLMGVAGASAVAYLGAASRVAEMVSLLAEGVMLAVFPTMAAAPERVAAVAADVGRRLAVLVLGAVVAVSAGAAFLVRVLFGPDYAAGAAPLAILAWSAVLATTGTLVLHGLIATGRQRLLLVVNLVAASAAVALQVLLVPRYQLVGSAVATVAAMACGQLLLAIVPASRPAVLASWRAALPAIGIGLGAQGVVTALGVSGLLAAVSTVVVFGLGVWLTGLVGPDDLVALRAAVARARER